MLTHNSATFTSYLSLVLYRGADKSLARPTSRCILFDGENISFDASLVLYIQGVTGGTDQTSGECSLC